MSAVVNDGEVVFVDRREVADGVAVLGRVEANEVRVFALLRAIYTRHGSYDTGKEGLE